VRLKIGLIVARPDSPPASKFAIHPTQSQPQYTFLYLRNIGLNHGFALDDLPSLDEGSDWFSLFVMIEAGGFVQDPELP
jgi:hypothetical protein